MPEQDARDSETTLTESGAPPTPRVSGEASAGLAATDTPIPESSMRTAQLPEEPPVVSEPGDTLLSAGKPAARLELMVEDRFAGLDARLAELDARLGEQDQRLQRLERKKSIVPPEPRQKPWLWLVFLIGLVVVFQLLRAMR